MLESEFANFTYDENENTDSENNNIEENIMNDPQDDILEHTPSEIEDEINLNNNAHTNEPDSFVSSIINDSENDNTVDFISKENNEIFNNTETENVDLVEQSIEDTPSPTFLETHISTENDVSEDTGNQILPEDSDENSSEEKMEIIESYLNNQSGNISLTNKEELLKHYTTFKLNDIKSEFVKLGLKVPKGKKKELIDELINDMSSSPQ